MSKPHLRTGAVGILLAGLVSAAPAPAHADAAPAPAHADAAHAEPTVDAPARVAATVGLTAALAASGGDVGPGPGLEPPPAPGPWPVPNTLLPPGAAIGPHAAPIPPAATGTPKTYKVYATREGLVGHTTANGHKVVSNDHFVSLPSGRSLSPRGGNDYSVRVCSVTNHRCAYDPVWDVGPWNTRDNYWAKKANRENWSDLPRGKPEAQAAYQDGYNGGKDQFGRHVTNPAGIDLADGTIRQGLGYESSAWVMVTYLWTGGGLRGDVDTFGGVLNVRSGPSTSHSIVGIAGPYAKLPIECQQTGELITRTTAITGTTAITRTTSSDLWYRVGPGNYVSAAWVSVPSGTSIPTC